MINSIKKFYTASIKRQLMLGIALVHAFMMLFFVVDLVEKEKSFLHEQHAKQAQSLVKTLSANSTSWVLANDFIGLEEVVESMSHYPMLKYALVIDTSGHILAHTEKKHIGLYLSDDKSKKFLKGKIQTKTVYESSNIIDVIAPIKRNDQHIGWARIGLGKESINDGLSKVKLDGFIYVLAAILIGTIFAYFMGIGLTKSIYKIINTIQKTKEGDPNARTNLKRYDEIGTLSKEFDLMLKKLSDQYALLNSVIESTPDLIFLKNYRENDGKYIGCNESFCKFVGKQRDEIIGKSDLDLFGEELAKFFREKDKEMLEKNSTNSNEEWVTYPDGKKVLLDTLKTPLIDSTGSTIGVLGMSRDITERRESQKEIEKQNMIIFHQAKLASLGEMLANIAHQWRQPLNLISTAASGIDIQRDMGTLTDELMKDELNAILNAANYLSKTIDDFRDFMSVKDKAKELIHIKSVIDELQILVSASLSSNFIDLKINTTHNPEILLRGGELLQALLNIISNAKDVLKDKDIDETRVILLETKKIDNELHLYIQDSGGGIPQEIKEKIFEPYFTTKHQKQGTGIGLYMTMQIITKSLNGEIKIENKEFEHQDKKLFGARFDIILPLNQKAEN